MGILDKLSFLIPARSATGHALDKSDGYPENPATIDNGMGHEAAAAADESENVYVLCACEDGNVILSFISEDKLMQLMAEPANDDGRNRVS
jgi:hypothetical protein